MERIVRRAAALDAAVRDGHACEIAVVDNADWYGSMSAVDFVGDLCRHFRVGTMLARESVRARMAVSADGMSLAEFVYQAFQAYDFLHLYRGPHACRVQLGGSDQWGNITAGCELIRRVVGQRDPAFGITLPLATTRHGQKFGKSAGNAVWLDAQLSRPLDLYQARCRVRATGRSDAARC